MNIESGRGSNNEVRLYYVNIPRNESIFNALHMFLSFIIYELPESREKDSAGVFSGHLHYFEFEAAFILDWLPLKAREPCLTYLIHRWGYLS